MLFIYRLLINIFGPLVTIIATLKGRYGGSLKERLGFIEKYPAKIWFHAVSLGESQTAFNIIEEIFKIAPQPIILSVGTPAGFDYAQKWGQNFPLVKIIAAPCDFWGSPNRAFKKLNLEKVVIIETELWPNFILAAFKNNLKIILASGRISALSFPRYLKIKKLTSLLLSKFSLITTLNEISKKRLLALGAPKEITFNLGNPKFDHLSANTKKHVGKYQLLLGGSTHQGEEEILIKAYQILKQKWPDLKLILVPRHIKRASLVLKLAQDYNFKSAYWSEEKLEEHEILVVEKTGLLFNLYSLATVAFIGGTLNEDGHNPLEGAYWGKPLLYGLGMCEFREVADALLGLEAAYEVKNEFEIIKQLDFWFTNPDLAQKAGQKGQSFLAALPKIAPVLAKKILEQ